MAGARRIDRAARAVRSPNGFRAAAMLISINVVTWPALIVRLHRHLGLSQGVADRPGRAPYLAREITLLRSDSRPDSKPRSGPEFGMPATGDLRAQDPFTGSDK